MKRKNKKKYNKYLLAAIVFFIIIIIVLAVININMKEDNKAENNVFESRSTGTTDQGDVLISVIPLYIAEDKIEFEISANTHSVDLSQFDLQKITTLNLNGKEIKSINSLKLNGHHSSGKLVFNTREKIDVFTLKIKGIPAIEERIFSWGEV